MDTIQPTLNIPPLDIPTLDAAGGHASYRTRSVDMTPVNDQVYTCTYLDST